MEKNHSVKDYEMDYRYAVENFLGFSLEEQLYILADMKEFIQNTNDKWLIGGFNSAFGSYFDKLNLIYDAALEFSKIPEMFKNVYYTNLVAGFYNDFEKELKLLDHKNEDDVDIEYIFDHEKYVVNNIDSKIINPDRIYYQDLSFKDENDKLVFYGNLICAYANRNLEYMPMTKQVGVFFEPVLLDIYGEELLDYIKSFHPALITSIIYHLAAYHMPSKEHYFISTEAHKFYWEHSQFDSAIEALEYERKAVLDTVSNAMDHHKKPKKKS